MSFKRNTRALAAVNGLLGATGILGFAFSSYLLLIGAMSPNLSIISTLFLSSSISFLLIYSSYGTWNLESDSIDLLKISCGLLVAYSAGKIVFNINLLTSLAHLAAGAATWIYLDLNSKKY